MHRLSAAGPTVTVAVVSWNTRDLLDACLRSLEPSVSSGVAEIRVVDNGSTDGTVDLVRERHPWVTLLERPDNPGFGPAANVALQDAVTPYVAVANADLEVPPSAISALLGAAGRHPTAGVLAPRLRLPDGAPQHSVHPFPSLAQAAAVDLGLAALVPGARRALTLEGTWDPDTGRDVDWAHGAFLVLPLDVWRALGGFAEDLWMYAEDLDLCWRARRLGRPTRYVPDAEVVHHVSAATAQAFGDERFDRSQAAAYRWMASRLGRPRALAIAGAAWMGGLVRLGTLRVASRRDPAAYGWRRDRARASVARHRAGVRAVLRG